MQHKKENAVSADSCTLLFCSQLSQSNTVLPASTNGSSMPQHAAACRSARFWELLVGVLKHAAACRSMPQRAKIFTWRTFFSIPCQTCEPFVAQISQNWLVAQWEITRPQCEGSWVPFLQRAMLKGQFFACQFLSIAAQTFAFLVLF